MPARQARRLVLIALGGGIAADILFDRVGIGINVPMAVAALILGAALAHTDPDRACKLLLATRAEASERGLLPLVWPCALLLAEVDPESARAHRRVAGNALHSLLRRADPIGRRLAGRSPWVPDLAGLTG